MSRQGMQDVRAPKSARSSSRFRAIDGRHASPAAVLRLLKETGFLYPDKRVRMNMDEVLATLEALWSAGGGATLKTLLLAGEDALHGHLAVLRVYERTWWYQHLAASKSGAAAQGGKQLVLAGVGLAEAAPQMIWLKAWYRPGNAWPDRTFGSFARRVADPARSHFQIYDYWVAGGVPAEGQRPAQLTPATAEDRAFIEACFAARGEPAKTASGTRATPRTATASTTTGTE